MNILLYTFSRFSAARIAKRLQRAANLLKNQPIRHYTDDNIWTPAAKWAAIFILDEARRAVSNNRQPNWRGL